MEAVRTTAGTNEGDAMRIEVTSKGMEMTPPIEEHARTKSEKLLKYFDGIMEIEMILHAAERESFHVEVMVDVVKHEPLIGRAEGTNVYSCIDQAVDKAQRQLTEYKERLRDPRRAT